MACGGCGEEVDGNFCVNCGRRRLGGDGPVLLNVAAPDNEPEQFRVRRNGLQDYLGLLAVATLVVLGMVVFLIDRTVEGQDESANNSPSTSPAIAPSENNPETEPPPSTPLPGNTADPAAARLAPIDSSGNWLGEPVGWYAFIRTGRGMVRIDLDTGEREPFWSDLVPLVNTGKFAVFREPGSGQLAAIALEDFPASGGEHPALFPDPFPGSEEALVGSDVSAIWRSAVTGSGWTEVDLDGRRVRRTISGAASDARGQIPDLVSRAGGIYRLFEGNATTPGYRRVGDGELRIHGFGRALIRRCDEILRCTDGWFDASTLQPLPDLASPPSGVDRLTAQGGVAVLTDGRFFNVETGAIFEIPAPRNLNLQADRISISSDGNLVIDANRFTRTVTNLSTGETRSLDDLLASGDSVMFIAKSPVG